MTDATPVTAPPGPIAQRLGHAGLLPFVFGALFAWLITHEQAHAFTVDGLAKYAAVIISFLGGIHWGAASTVASWAWAPLDRAARANRAVAMVLAFMVSFLARIRVGVGLASGDAHPASSMG